MRRHTSALTYRVCDSRHRRSHAQGNIGLNLKFGLGDEVESAKADEAAIQKACLTAAAWSDIQEAVESEESGLDVDVGFRGKKLNQGLCQRLCLARWRISRGGRQWGRWW